MTRDWLLYLVIFSLALNLGTIGAVLYLHYQETPEKTLPLVSPRPDSGPPPGLRGLFRSLNLDHNQKQTLRQMFPGHRREVLELRKQLAQKRWELFELLKAAEPSEKALAGKIKEISTTQGNLEKKQVQFLLELKKTLRPEQQEMLLTMLGQRLCRHRPHRRHRGMPDKPYPPGPGRRCGPGMGPPGPPPAEPGE